jgi:thymidylate synthase
MVYHDLVVSVNNIDEAFESWYNLLTNDMQEESSRDGEVVGEVINAITLIKDPTRCIMKNTIRKLPIRYCIGELLWYLSGNNNLSAIQHYSSSWDRMSDDGKTVNSNYGQLIQSTYGFNQLTMCEDLLRKDPNSRQAVIHLKPPRDVNASPTKDLPCTVSLQFFIRDQKLYMTTYMRSNDIWMGFPYDVFQFTCMQILLAMKLNVDLGSYTHIAGSLHLYKRNYKEDIDEN